jgi:hypothetical protein
VNQELIAEDCTKCADVVRSLNILNVCVSRTSAQLRSRYSWDIDADWMSVKLKEKSQ